MTDEEKKIEILKKYINSQEQKIDDYYKIDEEFYKDEIEQLEFSIKLLRYISNLIEKKSKEIEELKEKNKELCREYCPFRNSIIRLLNLEVDADNDKIISLIDTLVSEVNRLENIEDRKVQLEYERVYNKGVKSVEEKIQEEIKEINNEQLNVDSQDYWLQNEIKGYAIDKLRKILGEIDDE